MTQQTAPFIEAKYGWNYGESGWNTGVDEDLLKYSFLFDRNIDQIVSSLPSAVSGKAYFLTTDNRLYFAVGTTYYSSPTPKWFTIYLRSTGAAYQFNGTSLNPVNSEGQVETRLSAIELTLSSLGTASTKNTEFFASQASLDVESAQSRNYTDTKVAAITPSTLNYTASGGSPRTIQSKFSDLVSIKDFGAIGDGATNNDVAFSACEASSNQSFFVPQGDFILTNPLILTKRYYGPGLLNGNGLDEVPGNFARWSTPVLPIPQQGYPYYWRGDTSKSTQEFYIIDDIRTRIGEPYYCGQTTPHMQRLDNRAGTSGTIARIAVASSIGDITAILNSTEGLAIGDQIGFGSITGSLTDIRTITAISAGPPSIGFVGGLTNAYPVGTSVAKGLRTMNTLYHQQLDHRGGGDGYCMLFRVEASYAAKAGQDHFYFTSTAGPGGGDLVASADGVYLSGWEFTFDGTSHDAAAISDIRSYLRNVNTSQRHEVWIDRIAMSAGSVACDVGYEVAGKWKCGIDLARADFSSNGNSAIGLSSEQRIYFNSSVNDPTNPYPLWANKVGDCSIHHQVLNNRMKFTVAGVSALNLSSTNASFPGSVETAAGGLSTVTNGKVYLNGIGGNTYLTYNGTNILLFKNGTQVASW